MKTYRTSQIASMIGVHPNTIRFYEAQNLLPPISRAENGYRVFTRRHILQLRFLRLALRAEILSDDLRGEAIRMVKAAAAGEYAGAIRQTRAYRAHLEAEIGRAREAIALAGQMLSGEAEGPPLEAIGRREAAAQIGVSMDVLRDWERNGLLHIPRSGHRRRYASPEMNCLKIIAVLRHANYSQMSIRRMLQKLRRGETDLAAAIDTPEDTEDIVSVADRYLSSLTAALADTGAMLRLLKKMQSAAQTLQ